jgi:hypothetical protein
VLANSLLTVRQFRPGSRVRTSPVPKTNKYYHRNGPFHSFKQLSSPGTAANSAYLTDSLNLAWTGFCHLFIDGPMRMMVGAVRIPMKAATDSDGKRPPVPIQNGHFGRGVEYGIVIVAVG